MTPTQVTDMFQSYMDESDNTFITTTQVELYLNQAYMDFRRAVCNIDPYIFLTTHLLDVSGNSIDLSVASGPSGDILCGELATPGRKLERLLRVARINTTSSDMVLRYLSGSPSEKTVSSGGYALAKTSIILGATYSGAFRLEYVPQPNVVFTGGAGVASDYLDELDGFHDMIPLYAYQRYAIRDAADLPQITQELMRKLAELATYLEQGRSHEGSQFVSSNEGW